MAPADILGPTIMDTEARDYLWLGGGLLLLVLLLVVTLAAVMVSWQDRARR